jgi:hypothetical protein
MVQGDIAQCEHATQRQHGHQHQGHQQHRTIVLPGVPAVALDIACGLHNLSSPLADDFLVFPAHRVFFLIAGIIIRSEKVKVNKQTFDDL